MSGFWETIFNAIGAASIAVGQQLQNGQEPPPDGSTTFSMSAGKQSINPLFLVGGIILLFLLMKRK